MKTYTILLALFLSSSSLLAQDNSTIKLGFENVVTNYTDIPTINIVLKPQAQSSFGFIIEYANNLFAVTKEKDENYKVHSLYLAMNYKF